MKLNRTGSNWNRLERNKINENWDIIEGSYNDVVGQITDEVVGHLIDSARLDWKEPVDTVGDLPANAEVGETRMVREADPDGISYVYRYDGEKWEKIQAIDVTLVNEVDNRLSAQLAETRDFADMSFSSISTRKKQEKPIITFLADDCTLKDYTDLKQFILDKNVKVTLAVITSRVGTSGYMNFEQIKEMKELGCEILFHSHSHQNYTTLTKEEIDQDIRTGLAILKQQGIVVNGFVYPFNAYDYDKTVPVVQRYFNFAFAKKDFGNYQGRNDVIMTNQAIDRIALGSYFDGSKPEYPTDTSSLEYYISRVDEAIDIKNWVVFMIHSDVTTSEQWQHMRDLVDYIRSKNVDIVSATEGFEIYGNIMQIGTTTSVNQNHFWMNRKGEISSNMFRYFVERLGERSELDAITDFPQSRTVVSSFTNAQALAAGLPENAGGVMFTTRGTSEWYNAVRFYIAINGSGRVYKSLGKSDYTWGAFEPIEGVGYRTETPLNKYSASDPPSAFPSNRVTSFPVNVNGGQGFPGNSAGIVTVYRLGDNYAYSKMEFRPYASTGLWQRTGLQDNTWGDWLKIG